MLVRIQPEQPFTRVESDCRQRPRTVEVMAGIRFQCARVNFFSVARVAQFTERGGSNAEDGGAIPSASARTQGVMSAADGLVRNQEAAGASPATLTISRKAGRYKLAAPVSKTVSVTTEVGALPTPYAI